MLGELADPAVQYMVSTAYVLKPGVATPNQAWPGPAGPGGAPPGEKRLYMVPIWFHADTAWNLELGDDALACDLIMQEGSTQTTRVRILFADVYRISRMTRPDGSPFEDDDSLYWNQAVFDQMFVAMNAALIATRQ